MADYSIHNKIPWTDVRQGPTFSFDLEEAYDNFGEALALLFNVVQNDERDQKVHIIGEIKEFLHRFTKEI